MDDYWRAVALLRLDRPRGLVGLQRCFGAGAVPAALSGSYRGRLVAVTVGRAADPLLEGVFGRWLPWRGKQFADGGGCNLFTAAGCRLIRLRFPSYGGVQTEPDGSGSAFAFRTSVGPSSLDPATGGRGEPVLRIDYGQVTGNPEPVRQVLDELVEVGPGHYLGQVLLRRAGRCVRAAWFSLEQPSPAG